LIAIPINNRQNQVPVDRPRLRRAIRAIIQDANIRRARISVAVVDNPTIAALHRQFLDDPTPTDVLSFLLEHTEDAFEGEVVVSAETARAVAADFGATPEDELLLYVIHGTLHLVGYDDTTPRKRAVMRKKERKYLAEDKS
jgi:probable rRNA maturation factor